MVFYMVSIIQSLHIPALNGKKHTPPPTAPLKGNIPFEFYITLYVIFKLLGLFCVYCWRMNISSHSYLKVLFPCFLVDYLVLYRVDQKASYSFSTSFGSIIHFILFLLISIAFVNWSKLGGTCSTHEKSTNNFTRKPEKIYLWEDIIKIDL
jgi:hypothetical protein